MKKKGVEVEYLWPDGSDTSLYIVSEPGEYNLTVKMNGCTKREKISLMAEDSPEISLGEDTTLCPGNRLILRVDDFEGTWMWGNGSQEQELEVSESGKYYVEAELNGCKAADTIEVSFVQDPPNNLNWDTLICRGEEVVLETEVVNANYVWSDNSQDVSLIVQRPGVYWVDAQNDCYTSRKTFTVSTQECDCEVFVPNVMTPNNDGINEEFRIKLKDGVDNYHLMIFDRWGKSVFQTRDRMERWDGILESFRLAPEGVYYWIVTFECLQNGTFRTISEKGHITLLR